MGKNKDERASKQQPLSDEAMKTMYRVHFPSPEIRCEALKTALDIRKFEIELYWKRAAYFWTFIAATFVAFGAVQQLHEQPMRTEMSVVASCLGLLFSCAWFFINKGSKYWQTNWEKHVELLENEFIGPLYKTNWTRERSYNLKELIVGPNRFSVTKINQVVSLFVCAIWAILLGDVFPFGQRQAEIEAGILIVLTVGFCILIPGLCRIGENKQMSHFIVRGQEDESTSSTGPVANAGIAGKPVEAASNGPNACTVSESAASKR